MLKAETIAIMISRRARLAVLVGAMILLVKSLAVAMAPPVGLSVNQAGVDIPAHLNTEPVPGPDK